MLKHAMYNISGAKHDVEVRKDKFSRLIGAIDEQEQTFKYEQAKNKKLVRIFVKLSPETRDRPQQHMDAIIRLEKNQEIAYFTVNAIISLGAGIAGGYAANVLAKQIMVKQGFIGPAAFFNAASPLKAWAVRLGGGVAAAAVAAVAVDAIFSAVQGKEEMNALEDAKRSIDECIQKAADAKQSNEDSIAALRKANEDILQELLNRLDEIDPQFRTAVTSLCGQ
ncbi:hypothetical protein HDU96_003899 [Phlyctochytrium bullatum]|nr:hypothetical protein HDU96_003899 [Phlyctochytrium bullatum]